MDLRCLVCSNDKSVRICFKKYEYRNAPSISWSSKLSNFIHGEPPRKVELNWSTNGKRSTRLVMGWIVLMIGEENLRFFNAIELTTLVLYHIPILIGISVGRNKIGISRKRAHSQSTHYAYVGLHGWGRNWKAFYKKLLPNLFVIQLFSHKTSFFSVLK